MEYLISPGNACFTPSEAAKLVERIVGLGVRVNDIRGVWMHYTHLRESDQGFVKVSSYYCTCYMRLFLFSERDLSACEKEEGNPRALLEF